MTQRGDKRRQTMLTKLGGCAVYDGCPACLAAMEAYKQHHRQMGMRGGEQKVRKGFGVKPKRGKHE